MSVFRVFTDESGLSEQYLGLGGIFIDHEKFIELESILEEYAEERDFGHREFSFKRCDKSTVDRYLNFVNLGLSYMHKTSSPENWGFDFRCFVSDTHKTPLNYGADDKEQGFYRFYYELISKSLSLLKVRDKTFELNIADKQDQYPFRTEILEKTVGGTLKQRLGKDCQLSELKRGSPRDIRVHQLADVLLGAVTYQFNGRSNSKKAVVDLVEEIIGKPLDLDFKPRERPFNVWYFTRTGQRRTNKGASGIVG